MTHSGAQGNAPSAGSFIQSGPETEHRFGVVARHRETRARGTRTRRNGGFLVDALRALAPRERRVDGHDGSSIHDEADLA